MDGGKARDRALGHVDFHLHAVVLGHVADLLRLGDATARQEIGMDDRERVRFEERLEVLLEVDVLARAERRRRRGVELLPLLDVAPGEDILRPGEVVLLQPPQQLHAVLVGDVPEMVDRDRHFPADDLAHVRHVLLKEVEPLLRDVDARVAMRRREELERLAAHGTRVDRAVRRLDDVLHLAHVVEIAQGRDERVLDVRQ